MELPGGIQPAIFELPIPVAEIAKLYTKPGDILVIRYAQDRQPSHNAVQTLKMALENDGLRGIILLLPDNLDLQNIDTIPESEAKALYRVLQTRFEP